MTPKQIRQKMNRMRFLKVMQGERTERKLAREYLDQEQYGDIGKTTKDEADFQMQCFLAHLEVMRKGDEKREIERQVINEMHTTIYSV